MPFAVRVCAAAAAGAALLTLGGCTGTADDGATSPTASAGPSVAATSTPEASPTAASPSAQVSASTPAPSVTVPDDSPSTPSTDDDGGTKSGATVVIAVVERDAAQGVLRVQAVLTGLAVDDGQCTATARADGEVVETHAPATFNVDRTECGALELPLADLTPGPWRIKVEFSDGVHDVTPAEREVTVR